MKAKPSEAADPFRDATPPACARTHKPIRLFHVGHTTPSFLEQAINATLARAGGEVVSVCRDGGGYLVVIETPYTGIL